MTNYVRHRMTSTIMEVLGEYDRFYWTLGPDGVPQTVTKAVVEVYEPVPEAGDVWTDAEGQDVVILGSDPDGKAIVVSKTATVGSTVGLRDPAGMTLKRPRRVVTVVPDSPPPAPPGPAGPSPKLKP